MPFPLFKPGICSRGNGKTVWPYSQSISYLASFFLNSWRDSYLKSKSNFPKIQPSSLWVYSYKERYWEVFPFLILIVVKLASIPRNLKQNLFRVFTLTGCFDITVTWRTFMFSAFWHPLISTIISIYIYMYNDL